MKTLSKYVKVGQRSAPHGCPEKKVRGTYYRLEVSSGLGRGPLEAGSDSTFVYTYRGRKPLSAVF
jgi:hypothetical protein